VSALPVLETMRVLRLTRPGRLLPWLGPALRGLAARRLKARVCRFPAAVQEGERRYCKGCPYIAPCAYGRTVEPDPPPGARAPPGQEDAVRPLVIAAAFPAPAAGVPGLGLPVRVAFIGRTAVAHADEFWAALAEAGRDPSAGFDAGGPGGRRFPGLVGARRAACQAGNGGSARPWHCTIAPSDA
jgi:hypothetical protein